MSYSKELRQKALEDLEKGYSKKDVSEKFKVHRTTLRNWEKLRKETGSLENRDPNRKSFSIDLEELKKYCEKNPFATHRKAALYFGVSERVIIYYKNKIGITRKNKTNKFKEKKE
ncbi:MAG: IS630 transposase-related protein [Defluviitaleaceae bacterium]|nr:IS630 transposase-related protein [Defluviitaleaceae bacterium]